MQQPQFWFDKSSKWGKILSPLGRLYEKSIALRFSKAHPYQPNIPVICVGNINIGGTGKTPLCAALARYYKQKNKNVFFLNHGYKSATQNVLVDLRTHTPQQVSDEALMLATLAPTVVDKDRKRGLTKAVQNGADLVIMDDGFQNPSVIKTLSLVIFDGKKGIGNGYCLPAGPLREGLKQSMKRADAAVIAETDKTNLEKQIKSLFPDLPVLKGHVECHQDLHGLCAVAFAGIGTPEKFFNLLEQKGVTLIEKHAFTDHHLYTDTEVKKMISRGYPLLTTSKDIVKINPKLQAQITVVDIDFIFDDLPAWNKLLEDVL